MPVTKSAKKRMRTSGKARIRNRAARSLIRAARTTLDNAVADGNADLSRAALNRYFSVLDKAAKRGIVSQNTASRRKARSARKLATPSTTPAS